MEAGVWTPVLRPSTTPRRGAVSTARTTASSAQAPLTASSVTPPTMSLMACVQSWSVEKVNKVTALLRSCFSCTCCFRQRLSVRDDLEKCRLAPVHPPLSHPLLLIVSLFLSCCLFPFFRGGRGSRL